MSADDIYLLIIVGAYFAIMARLLWLAGQFLLIMVEALADWCERRWG